MRSDAIGRKKSATTSPTKPTDKEILFDQLKQIARGLGETFAPFCEVVLHDLTDPNNAIVAIHNNLSGRKIGQPATKVGLARIRADPNYAEVVSNYANKFAEEADRPKYVCRHQRRRQENNTSPRSLSQYRSDAVSGSAERHRPIRQRRRAKWSRGSLNPASADAIRARVDQFAARGNDDAARVEHRRPPNAAARTEGRRLHGGPGDPRRSSPPTSRSLEPRCTPMQNDAQTLDILQTPCLLLDETRLRANVDRLKSSSGQSRRGISTSPQDGRNPSTSPASP